MKCQIKGRKHGFIDMINLIKECPIRGATTSRHTKFDGGNNHPIMTEKLRV